MKSTVSAWSALALLAPLAAGCAAQATVTPPVVSGTVDANAGAAAAVDANGNVVGAGAPTDDYQDTDPSALTDFHQTLDSHGTWVDDPTYGTVWIPNGGEVGASYTPYTTAGHWAYDANDDYVWVSDYDWGWAPYHYGRWVDIEGRGWSWIPGREYRGAWVTWGADDGYGTVGWAPMPPEYVWRGGAAVSYTYAGPSRWSYVGRGDVFATNVGARVYTGQAAASAAGSVHLSAGGGVSGHSGGPSPTNLGMSAAQVPHVTAASSAGIAKAQNFGHASTATSLGGHPPSLRTSSTLMPGSMRGGATATTGHAPAMTPSSTLMPGSMKGGATTTPATTGRTMTETRTPPSLPPTHTTATTTTTTTLQVPPKGKKRPMMDSPAPTPKAGGTGGHTGGGGGGGHGGGSKPQ